ncbi:MAG TPA: hypothetical protein VGE63_00875 [Candidatus Paceibacterota bacterium]
MNTHNPHNKNFESLAKNAQGYFSLSAAESQKLNDQFRTKLAQHQIRRHKKTTSPFFSFIFSQKVVAAAFSVVVVVSGLYLNYFTNIDTASQYQNTLIQNNIALLVKNPVAFTPEMRSSLISAHTAYANSIEENVTTKPEETLVSSTAILGLYQSALSMLMINKDSSSEVLSFVQSLVNDMLKRNQEYEEQLAITSMVGPNGSTQDYSQIIRAIKDTLNESESIIKEHPELATPKTVAQLEDLTHRINALSDANIHEIKTLLKETADLYEYLSLSSVL